MSEFSSKVYEVVSHIPPGQTLSYGEVAALAGSPGAARAVGTLMAQNFDPSVPCHRVIRADGKLGAYNRGGEDKKRALLIAEGAIKK